MLRLKELREAHDPPLTQAALGYMAGVSARTVYRAETLGQAHSTTLRKLANALGVPVGALFNEEGAA